MNSTKVIFLFPSIEKKKDKEQLKRIRRISVISKLLEIHRQDCFEDLWANIESFELLSFYSFSTCFLFAKSRGEVERITHRQPLSPPIPTNRKGRAGHR